jgi:hypothetical protein
MSAVKERRAQTASTQCGSSVETIVSDGNAAAPVVVAPHIVPSTVSGKVCHPVRSAVREEVRVMRSRFAEDLHHPPERRVHTGSHVQRFDRKPRRIYAKHLSRSRSQVAQAAACETGPSTFTVVPARRSSTRNVQALRIG